VWGGAGNTPGSRDVRSVRDRNDGGRYDPKTDRWRRLTTEGAPSARWRARAFWTGNRMLVCGGSLDDTGLADGAFYVP
jgi:N-acetylneuraminic acid mutarotase